MTWKRLAHQEITSTGDNFSEFTFDSADILKVVMYVVKQGTGDFTLYPNAVTSGSNFSAKYTKNGGGYSGNNNHCGIHGNYGQLAGNTLATYHINNLKNSEKLVQWNYCIDTGSASTNLPDRFEAVGKYTDTSNQITSFSATLNSGGFGAGSYITVWGDASDVVSDEKQTLADATRTELATATTTLDLSSASQTGTADTKFSVNTSSQQIDWEAKHDGSFDSIWWDLGASAVSDTAWVLHWTLNIDNKPEGNKWLITSLSSSVDSNGRNHRNSNSDSLCLTLTRHNDNGYSYFHIHDTDGASFGGSSNPNSGDGTATYDFPLDTDLFCELRRTSATEYIGTIRTGSHTGTVIGTITGSCASTVTGLRYLQFSNWDTTSVYDNGTFDGYIKDVKLYNNATEYSSTVSEAPNAGTQYRETDTRKIYRKTTPTSAFFDYTDGSNTGWSWAGTGFTFDSTTDKRIEFTEQRSNHRIWYDLGSDNKGDSDFTMRFEINLTSYDGNNGGQSMTFVCVSNNGDNLTSTNDSLNAFNYSGNGWRQSTADGQRNDSTSDQTGNLGSISAGDTHYMEMKRSGTTFTLSRYTDSTYSTTTWTNYLSIGSGITGLRYIKVQSGYQGNKVGWIDNIRFYETASVSTDEWKERGSA